MTDKTHSDEPYKDENTLRKLYHSERMSMVDIADELGVTKSKVRYWMEKHEIDRRGKKEAMNVKYNTLKMTLGGHGYERFQHQYDGESYRLQHHRLLAVAECGFEKVFGKDVHHENGIPWDNRPENLTLLARSVHASTHNSKHSIINKLAVMEFSKSTSLKYREIADLKDIPLSTVCSIASGVKGGS